MVTKPILCLDFDGVCHSYSSGWQGATVIPDPPVPGLFEFLESVAPHFQIHVFSSRSHQAGGRDAMMAWFYERRKEWRAGGGKGEEVITLHFPEHKPSAKVSIDDRAITFSRHWPSVEQLVAFEPWNRRERYVHDRPGGEE